MIRPEKRKYHHEDTKARRYTKLIFLEQNTDDSSAYAQVSGASAEIGGASAEMGGASTECTEITIIRQYGIILLLGLVRHSEPEGRGIPAEVI